MLSFQWPQQVNTFNTKYLFFRPLRVTNLIIVLLVSVFTTPTQADEGGDARLYHSPEGKREISNTSLMNGVTAGILVEIEACYTQQGNETSSDITLATFEFSIDAELSDNIKGHTLLLWEEDDTEPLDLDEATITLGGNNSYPIYLSAGKMYVPFGAFNSHFISDPLVLELGETRESAATLGYASDIINVKVSSFNGSMDNSNDDQAKDIAASISLTPWKNIELGAYWMSDLGESDVLKTIITDAISTNVNYAETGGAGAYIAASAGCFFIDIEYLSATESFNPGILNTGSKKPSALNIECALHCFDKYDFASKYEQTEDFQGFPEKQYGACCSYSLDNCASISIEYLIGAYSDTHDKQHLVTTQLAMEF